LINIIVALAAEAKPIIAYYKLKRNHAIHAFPLYSGKDMNLVVTGSGKLASAAATGFVAGFIKNIDIEQNSAWLNVGIAGHRDRECGTAVLAHKIIEKSSTLNHYPFVSQSLSVPGVEICTVEVVETEYADDLVYDMEACGFFVAASRQTSLEFIQCLKIISDNHTSNVYDLKPNNVSSLIENNLEIIEETKSDIMNLFSQRQMQIRVPAQWLEWRRRFHFSETQNHLLRNLFYNLQALDDMKYIDQIEKANVKDAADLISILQNRVESY